MRQRAPWLALLLCGALGVATPAAAQGDLDQRREQAAELADKAFELLQKGDYDAAYDRFFQADELFHSPVFLLYMAEAREKQGRLLEAYELLRRIVDEKLAEYAPESFRKAQADAKARLATVEKRVPMLVISVEGAEGPVEVAVDGEPITAEQLANPIPVDAGEHTVTLTGEAGTAERQVTAVEGERVAVSLVIGASDSADPDTGEGPDGQVVGAGIAFGLGGVGLLIGAIAGGVFIGEQSDLKAQCAEGDPRDSDPNTCPEGLASTGDDVTTLGNVATFGWVLFGAGVVAGTLVLVIPMDDEEDTTVRLTPTGFSLQQRF